MGVHIRGDVMATFTAHLFHVGLHFGVLVPADVVDALGGRHFMDVHGTVNGEAFSARLAPADEGQQLLYFTHDVRQRAAIEVGDDVTVEVWPDGAREGPT